MADATSFHLPKPFSHSSRKATATRQKSSSRPQRPAAATGPRSGTSGARSERPLQEGGTQAPQRAISRAKRAPSVPAVAVFARAVRPGKTKTRLIPALGAEGAARFHRALVSDALGKIAGLAGRAECYIFTAGGTLPNAPNGPKGIIPRAFERRRQRGRNLAQRLSRAFAELLRRHSRAVIIGTDSPTLAPAMLRLALGELRATDAVLGPCPDGGYYLIGLRRTVPGLFNGLRLGTEFAFADTLASLLAHGLSCSVLEPCPDIDRPGDLAALEKFLSKNPAARRLAPHTWRFLSKW